MQILQPAAWPRPRGYSNGVVATGRMIFVAGQVGWDNSTAQFRTHDLVGQVHHELAAAPVDPADSSGYASTANDQVAVDTLMP